MKIISVLGLVSILGLAVALSKNRRAIDWKTVAIGCGLQITFAWALLRTGAGLALFHITDKVIKGILHFSDQGAEFLFGPDFQEHYFAFKVLSSIVFMSSLSYVLFYCGILPRLIRLLAFLFRKTMGISGVDALVSSANVLFGQTEAPLFVKPYLEDLTRSERMTLMTCGMATVAGGVMAAFVGFGISAGHLLTASLMSAPAALVLSKILIPEDGALPDAAQRAVSLKFDSPNIFAAACDGAREGMKLSLNIGAMLIAITGLIALLESTFSTAMQGLGLGITLDDVFGYVFSPIAFLMGIEGPDIFTIGTLIGKKIVFNEFIAFQELAALGGDKALTTRAFDIATYGLCGFANFTSIAIVLGGIGALVPSRKKELARDCFLAMVAGNLASFMTGCIAGLLI